jgi:hypothetical protein
MRSISQRYQALLLILGVVMAGYIICPPQFSHAPVDDSLETRSQEAQNDAELSEWKADAVPSASQPPVERNSYLIETLPKVEEKETEPIRFDRFLPSPSKVLEVLFEHILSPNSP